MLVFEKKSLDLDHRFNAGDIAELDDFGSYELNNSDVRHLNPM